MTDKRKFRCRNCGHIAAHGRLETDGDGTKWYYCKQCKRPFGVMAPEFVREIRRRAW